MKFRTEITIPSSPFNISHQDKIMMIGSCFVENISTKLQESGFYIRVNPFGIVYNPVSVKMVLESISRKKEYTEKDLFLYQGLYHSFSHHSRYSGTDSDSVACAINEEIKKSLVFLQEAKYLFITLGTANVYFLSDSGTPVANCHKLPASTFYSRRLTPAEIVNDWNKLLFELKELNPEIKIIFTISPIRHWKDGFYDNQVSKSILFVAVDLLMQNHPYTYYFPSYELLMDDLRDYRFYAEDMLHPTVQAIEYIWGKFTDTYFSDHTKKLIREWRSIQQALNHRSFNPESEENKIFRMKTENKKMDFLHKNPAFKHNQ